VTAHLRRRWLIGGLVAFAVLVALIPIGRWERNRHANNELAGMRTVLAAIGPFDQPALDAYRRGVGPGLNCLLYRRGSNPFALEVCYDRSGRVVEGYDRRGKSPRIWSLREDPSASTIHADVGKLNDLVARLQRQAA
jgi:hypothetical protein